MHIQTDILKGTFPKVFIVKRSLYDNNNNKRQAVKDVIFLIYLDTGLLEDMK